MPNLAEKTKQSSSKVTSPIFKVPVWLIERKFQCLDGSFLQGERESTFLVEAESAVQAVELLTESPRYLRNYNQLPREKRKETKQVFKLGKGEPIRIPDCERRHKDRNGDYICGRPKSELEDYPDKDLDEFSLGGEFGGCCLEGYDSPPDCPMPKFYQDLLSLSNPSCSGLR